MRKPKNKIKSSILRGRLRRKLSVRKKIFGTGEKPRISSTKSNKHLFVQVIDDDQGKTLFSVQTYGKNAVKDAKCNKEGAEKVGAKLGQELKSRGISTAVFDRGFNKYTGVIQALADQVRKEGISI